MNESLRELLYPLGFLSSLAFGSRFLLQWMTSEYYQKSVVTKLFWKLSLIGNILLTIHAFIQIQYHVCLIQACNSVISWRNLNLMQEKADQFKLHTVLAILVTSVLTVTTLFWLQTADFSGSQWFRVPTNSWQQIPVKVNNFWHFLGFIGVALFGTRFWVQWWYAEQEHLSYLGLPFWWMSLVGGVLSLIYFAHLGDLVNLIGPGLGLIPYIRNLMLINKNKKLTKQTSDEK